MAVSSDTSCDLYTCAVCLEPLIDRSPRQLTCLHTFCLKCLQQLPVIKRKIKCPTCRQKTLLKRVGKVNALPVNFTIIKMKEYTDKLLLNKDSEMRELAQNIWSKQISLCHLCKNDTALYKCRDCDHLLCTTCINKHHGLEQFKEHCIAPVCPKHPEGVLSHICVKCVEAACSLCIIGTHAEHLTDVIQTCPNGIVSLQGFIEAGIDALNKKLERAKEIRQRRLEMIDKNQEFRTLALKHVANLRPEAIEKLEEDLLQTIKEKLQSISNRSQTVIDEFKLHITPDRKHRHIINEMDDIVYKCDSLIANLSNLEFETLTTSNLDKKTNDVKI